MVLVKVPVWELVPVMVCKGLVCKLQLELEPVGKLELELGLVGMWLVGLL